VKPARNTSPRAGTAYSDDSVHPVRSFRTRCRRPRSGRRLGAYARSGVRPGPGLAPRSCPRSLACLAAPVPLSPPVELPGHSTVRGVLGVLRWRVTEPPLRIHRGADALHLCFRGETRQRGSDCLIAIGRDVLVDESGPRAGVIHACHELPGAGSCGSTGNRRCSNRVE
jgi:hypothetical protein